MAAGVLAGAASVAWVPSGQGGRRALAGAHAEKIWNTWLDVRLDIRRDRRRALSAASRPHWVPSASASTGRGAAGSGAAAGVSVDISVDMSVGCAALARSLWGGG
ncbi:MAG: hypothetical protein Tsb0020_04300 [Haliangiales bacterium]